MEKLDNYINWLIKQRSKEVELHRKGWRKSLENLISKSYLETPGEIKEIMWKLEDLSEKGYFSTSTLEKIKSLPKENIVDIYFEIRKRVPEKPIKVSTIGGLIIIMLCLSFPLLVIGEILRPGLINKLMGFFLKFFKFRK